MTSELERLQIVFALKVTYLRKKINIIMKKIIEYSFAPPHQSSTFPLFYFIFYIQSPPKFSLSPIFYIFLIQIVTAATQISINPKYIHYHSSTFTGEDALFRMSFSKIGKLFLYFGLLCSFFLLSSPFYFYSSAPSSSSIYPILEAMFFSLFIFLVVVLLFSIPEFIFLWELTY